MTPMAGERKAKRKQILKGHGIRHCPFHIDISWACKVLTAPYCTLFALGLPPSFRQLGTCEAAKLPDRSHSPTMEDRSTGTGTTAPVGKEADVPGRKVTRFILGSP